VVVSQISQEIPLDSGSGTFTMDIKKEWLGGRFCVDVQGVLIDANGREQRATHHEPLNEGKPRLTLSLPKRVFTTNEAITIQTAAADENGKALRGKSTVVAMKLTPGQVSYSTPPEYLGDFGFSSSVIGYRRYGYGYGYRGYNPMPTAIPRVMATAVGFDGDKAELTLPDPGAYKLVVVTRTEDGKSITDEIGCIVRNADELAGLHFTADKREYTAGENLVAEIQSRFADARILVTLRDSQGVRLWKPLQLTGQTAKLNLRLPEDARYACNLVIQYVEGNGKIHVADQIIRVVPAHRFISIKTEHKDQVAPGDTVKLSLNVNRAEPVDLVVSVYDQSLLGITSNKQTDIRSFYFADERIIAAASVPSRSAQSSSRPRPSSKSAKKAPSRVMCRRWPRCEMPASRCAVDTCKGCI
jgi:alpha-2-macroglobulin